ncbi:MAG: hypothetical protein K8R75_09205 [Deltaproteobacteria bacterium]|nr:hypothetical protein [Deltaproteobacteria bacterium]
MLVANSGSKISGNNTRQAKKYGFGKSGNKIEPQIESTKMPEISLSRDNQPYI